MSSWYNNGPGLQASGKNAVLDSIAPAVPITSLMRNLLVGNNNVQYDPASQQLASLSSTQWQQGANLMYPAENQLINYAEDPNYVANQRAQAQTDTDNSFATQQQNQQQQLGLMGISPTAPQAAAMAKTNALAKAEGEAGSMNQAAQAAYQNQQGALRGFS